MRYCMMRLDDVVRLTGLLFVISINYYNSLANTILSLECPGNDVSTIRKESTQLELSLVLYYVSWCRESRAAKEIYTEVARHYTNGISFAAVNCWHLECNCSATIPSSLGSKQGYPHKWPTLIVNYGRHQMALQYNDEWNVAALSRFINNLMRPILRLNSKEDLKKLNMRSSAVLLGLFQNASVQEYQRFSTAAIKWLENDPERFVVFAVCLGAAANDIVKGMRTVMPLIVLVMDQEINIFNFIGRWRSNHLNTWLQNEVKRLSKFFVGFSTPPILLNHVRNGTVLAIFASDSEHAFNKNFYAHMSYVMESLGLSPSIPNSLKRNCEKFVKNNYKHGGTEIEIENEWNEFGSGKTFCKNIQTRNFSYYKTLFMESTGQFLNNYMMKFQPSVQFEAHDNQSTKNLLVNYKYIECLKSYQNQNRPEMQIVFAKLLTKFIKKIAENSKTRHNRTMSVQIMDTHKYHDILQTLGVAPHLDNVRIAKTTVLIIEPNQEGVYVLRKPFHYEELLRFIKDYYDDNLSISRKTDDTVVGHNDETFPRPAAYSVQDLSREIFLHRIQHFSHNTTTVLLLYTPRCAFSSMMSHALVQVSALLHDSQHFHHINMVRLNTQTNDLPWEFVTHVTPTLIVFPQGRPSESRTFPTNLKIDVRNVFAFILAQLDPIDQVRVALSSCSPTPTHQLVKCLHFVRTLAMQHIGDHLKLWQIFEKERHTILARLRQFKDITLDIQERFLL